MEGATRLYIKNMDHLYQARYYWKREPRKDGNNVVREALSVDLRDTLETFKMMCFLLVIIRGASRNTKTFEELTLFN
jgi:hypothetical protein